MKKKLLALLLACGMVFALAACGNDTADATPTPDATQTETPSTETPETETPETPTYEPATVRVAYMPNLGSASSLFTAIHQGYF